MTDCWQPFRCRETAHDFIEQLCGVAREAIVPLYRQLVTIDYKSDDSPVTVADREVEQRLKSLILERFPDHGFIGEEFGSVRTDARYVWVVDPIDGTKSFVTGRPLFGTLIAMTEQRAPKLGVIDMPMLDERWWAFGGQSTLFNEVSCSTSQCQDLSTARISATTPDMFVGEDRERFDALSRHGRFRTFGSDCYAYGLLASGHLDVVVEAELSAYDFMALVPVVERAGGCMTDWQGAALSAESDGRVLATAGPDLHEQALRFLHR